MVQIENCIAYFSKVILSDLKDMAGVRCWIAGGVVRDYFSSKPIVTDFDIFFPDEVNHKKAAEWFKRVNAEVIWESENGMKVKYKGKTFDLIKHYTDSPVACINSFDFTVSQFAVDTERVYYCETSFIDLAKKQLMVASLSHPASTMSRVLRYYEKGFRMCKGELAKIILAIQDMPKPEPKEPENDTESGDNESSGDFAGVLFMGID